MGLSTAAAATGAANPIAPLVISPLCSIGLWGLSQSIDNQIHSAREKAIERAARRVFGSTIDPDRAWAAFSIEIGYYLVKRTDLQIASFPNFTIKFPKDWMQAFAQYLFELDPQLPLTVRAGFWLKKVTSSNLVKKLSCKSGTCFKQTMSVCYRKRDGKEAELVSKPKKYMYITFDDKNQLMDHQKLVIECLSQGSRSEYYWEGVSNNRS